MRREEGRESKEGDVLFIDQMTREEMSGMCVCTYNNLFRSHSTSITHID